MTFAVCFTNFGPYHLARLRALAARLDAEGHGLIAYEVASREHTYPWSRSRNQEPFTWITLFAERVVETIDRAACRRAITAALDRDRPAAIFVVGYARPESMAAARWARRRGTPVILMSESQAIDRPHAWWKELIKMRRVRQFDAALVGGPGHRDYLAQLGMPPRRVALGYNAVDNAHFRARARFWLEIGDGRSDPPAVRYFLTVSRFASEKNLPRLIAAFARYRQQCPPGAAWDLVLCGDGPQAPEIARAIVASGWSHAIHRPGFLEGDALARAYAHASAFVLASVSEPWGLVVNEAAASGLPLLVSSRAGCAATLVPEPDGTTGARFDPLDIEQMTTRLAWMASLPDADRHAMGRRAAEVVAEWGPDRFARGAMEALDLARTDQSRALARRRAPPTGDESMVAAQPEQHAASATVAPSCADASLTGRARAGRWLHLCNGLDPVRDGGMVPSILGMTGALNRRNGAVTIVTPTPSQVDKARLASGLTFKGPEADLEQAIRTADVVHMHGLWQLHTRRGARIARSGRVPYLVACHGMADPWAMRHKRWKKRVYLAVVEGKNLRRAACLHALSRPEIGHLRAITPWTPICFVPNGVDLAPFDDLPARHVLENDHPEIKGKFVLLFFGRLHVKKGLNLLAEALGQIMPDHPELHLVVAGNDAGAWGPFRDRMMSLGLTGNMTCLGHVTGERARQVWGAADAFVLPSLSEGFSMAVLEALACRLPSLVTTACHFPELAAAGGGVVVAPDADAVEEGLRDLIDRAPAERAMLGETGRRLVEEHYTWDRQAQRLESVYEWLRGGGPPPEPVIA